MKAMCSRTSTSNCKLVLSQTGSHQSSWHCQSTKHLKGSKQLTEELNGLGNCRSNFLCLQQKLSCQKSQDVLYWGNLGGIPKSWSCEMSLGCCTVVTQGSDEVCSIPALHTPLLRECPHVFSSSKTCTLTCLGMTGVTATMFLLYLVVSPGFSVTEEYGDRQTSSAFLPETYTCPGD